VLARNKDGNGVNQESNGQRRLIGFVVSLMQRKVVTNQRPAYTLAAHERRC
jgi:hypothetical protein